MQENEWRSGLIGYGELCLWCLSANGPLWRWLLWPGWLCWSFTHHSSSSFVSGNFSEEYPKDFSPAEGINVLFCLHLVLTMLCSWNEFPNWFYLFWETGQWYVILGLTLEESMTFEFSNNWLLKMCIDLKLSCKLWIASHVNFVKGS